MPWTLYAMSVYIQPLPSHHPTQMLPRRRPPQPEIQGVNHQAQLVAKLQVHTHACVYTIQSFPTQPCHPPGAPYATLDP